MDAEVIDFASRRQPYLHRRLETLAEEAEHILRQLESVLGEHAMVCIEICGRNSNTMDDDLVCRYMTKHAAGMLEAYAERNRQAQKSFEEALRCKGTWPPQ